VGVRQGTEPAAALSDDGATIAFQSLASNLVCEGKCRWSARHQPGLGRIRLNRFARRTARVSTDIGEEWMENSRAPSLDDAGPPSIAASITGRDEALTKNLHAAAAPAVMESR
jgi:hypothetical protein